MLKLDASGSFKVLDEPEKEVIDDTRLDSHSE
jgi:hypothetical protein